MPPNHSPDDDNPTERPTAGARQLKSRVRPLRAWAPRSRALTADALALLGPAAAEAVSSPRRPLSLAAAATKPVRGAMVLRYRRRQWQPDGAGDAAAAAGPVAQTRATLALRVPVPALWPRGTGLGGGLGGGGGGGGGSACGGGGGAVADVAVRLPPGLRLAATSRGLPDIRLELLDVLVSWGQREGNARAAAAEGPQSASSDGRRRRRRPDAASPSFFGGRHHRIYPAAAPAAAFAVRGGALLLAHAMFPDAAARAAPLLALPAAAVDVAAPCALALAPSGVRALARDLWGGKGGEALTTRGTTKNKSRVNAEGQAKEDGKEIEEEEDDQQPPLPPPSPPRMPPLLPVRLAAAAAHAGVHALRSLSPPAAALASAAWIWRLVEPNSLLVLRGAAALAAVAADYNGLRRDAALGRFDAGGADDGDEGGEENGAFCGGRGGLDAARRRAHRRAARRVAPFMRDLPEGTPPLAPVLAALGRVSFAAALAVGGVPLSGAAGAMAGGAGGGSGSLDSSSSSTAWLGWDPSPALQVAVVIDASGPDAEREARRHAASGLDRGELLELFEGAPPEKEGGRDAAKAAAAAAAAVVVVVDACGSSSSSSADIHSPREADPIAFLDRLPLYGRPEASAVDDDNDNNADAPPPDDDAAAIVAAGREGRLVVSAAPSTRFPPALAAAARCARVARAEAELALRAAWLLLAFAPFAAAGLPLLAAAAALTDRARAREREALGSDGEEDEEEAQGPDDDDAAFWRDPARQQAAAAAWRRRQRERERSAAERRRERERERQLLLQSQTAEQAALARFVSGQMAALRVVLAAIAALLELLLLLALGGDWMASASAAAGPSSASGGASAIGGGPFEAAALRLRRAAWSLLLAGCARSGAAVIKCGQWAAVRRDLFPDDLCDALSALHDAAPSHAAGETRRALERAFGGCASGSNGALELFESFDWEPVASGSIAQVHRAVLRRTRAAEEEEGRHVDDGGDDDGGDGDSNSRGGCVVAVKVRHPGVARHIAMDFLLLRRLAALADRAPDWLTGGRGGAGAGDGGGASSGRNGNRTGAAPPLVHTLGQFSRTMAAQADLRVEAVHMMRFARDFAPAPGSSSRGGGGAFAFAGSGGASGVSGPVAVPLPVAGMATAEVLVETFEPGVSVGRYLAAAVAERAAQERRARERRLERRRRERECAEQQEEAEPGDDGGGQQQQQQQQAALPAPAAVRRRAAFAPLASVRALLAPAAAALGRFLRGRAAAWRERIGRRGRRRTRRRRRGAGGGDTNNGGSSSARSQIVALFLESYLRMLMDTGFMHQDLHPGNLLVRARGGGGGEGQGSGKGGARQQQDQQQQQQLVLLDFGLAEDLSPDVRRHFTSFLNHVAAGSPAHATRHLLRWSGRGAQRCPPRARRALLADMAELFGERCDLSSPGGVDLDAVLGRTLALVKRHGVSLDASYALLCMGCCAVVRCAAALDPRFNLVDAAAPELLCRALTGRMLGGCAAGL